MTKEDLAGLLFEELRGDRDMRVCLGSVGYALLWTWCLRVADKILQQTSR